jgi:hypothetical protein
MHHIDEDKQQSMPVLLSVPRFIDEYHLKAPNGTHKYKKAAEEAAARASTAEAKVAEVSSGWELSSSSVL